MSAARNTPSRGRFVWIGEDESIERLGAVEFARLVTKRRAEAPADPVAAFNAATWDWERTAPPAGTRGREIERTIVGLRALGGFPLETT